MPANIVVPEVGESIVDARVAKWLKTEGDAVAAGDPLVELETDKIDLEVAAPQAGVLTRIDHKDGADVKVGDVLGVIEPGPASAASPLGAAADDAAAQKTTGSTVAETPDAAGAAKTRATPTARKAAEQNAVDLTSLKGSGDAGRVMRRDVEQAAGGETKATAEPQQPAARPAAPVAPN
nr:biotin/lipoyl-binding protein [Acidobacteriota bacterium]